MPASEHRITPADLVPDAEYARQRAERRAALLPVKRLRRVSLGPFCTVIFESYETMLFQVQEMLLTEKGGAAQVPDELAAYNPLIPKGDELVATVMFEIDEPVRRAAALGRLGGVEHCFFLQFGAAGAGCDSEWVGSAGLRPAYGRRVPRRGCACFAAGSCGCACAQSWRHAGAPLAG